MKRVFLADVLAAVLAICQLATRKVLEVISGTLLYRFSTRAVLAAGVFSLCICPVKAENVVQLENKYFKMTVSPLGARVLSLQAKFLDAELTTGSFCEYDWMRRNRFFYNDKPFILTESRGDGKVSLNGFGMFSGGQTDFLTIDRKYTLSDNSTSIRVDYTFGNHPNAMSALDYALLIHTALGIKDCRCSYYFPTAEGIVEVERDKRPKELSIDYPSRGWMAAVDDAGRGLALTMPFRDVKSLYSWMASSNVPTLEWRMIPLTLKDGESYSVATEVLVFKGLSRVSGAGGGLVGEIADGKVTVYNCRAGVVLAKFDGQTRELHFDEPGQVRSFPSSATMVTLEVDGREVCRLDAPASSGKWNMPLLEKQRVSTVKGYDLTCYTNFPHQVCRPFAKPLSVEKPRVIALTGAGDAVEVGFFADRFDCEVLTTHVRVGAGRGGKCGLANPIYDSGEYFGKLSVSDVEANLLKTLKRPADVILVGGLPWGALPKSVQKLLLERVGDGVGLVWIGQNANAPEINRSRLAKRPVTAVPTAVGADFSDVPFAVFGAHPCLSFRPEGTVLARAGSAAYLTESRIGKGVVLHLAYKALFGKYGNLPGLTPDLKDFYPDGIAPSDYYYSLIAKCLLRACGRSLPARLEFKSLGGDAARLSVASSATDSATLEWDVRNSFGEAVLSGAERVALSAEGTDCGIGLASLPPHAGKYVFGAVLRDAEGRVMAWGDWVFEKKTSSRLSRLVAEAGTSCAGYYREGDTVEVVAAVEGAADGLRVEMSFADSYGRVLERKGFAAAGEVRGRFLISNALPTRMYEVTARLFDGDREIDRRRVEIRARPEPSKWAWDDFLFGLWSSDGVREYLWPERAKMFRRMHLDTNVSTLKGEQIDFPVRYGFTPTFKTHAGIGRCSEPMSFVKSRNKMDLVRTPCLSDRAFLEKQAANHAAYAKALANVGVRFVWFGDEQSLTGKGSTSIDFCFSEHCLAEFRLFLQGRYGSLARLNEAWATSFGDWKDVLPFTRDEIWAEGGERHIAGWMDHLEFMDGRIVNSLEQCAAAYRRTDPNIESSISGTQAPKAYGGMDWWRLIDGPLTGALSYSSGGQFDLHRSFRPDGGFMPWSWGYSRSGGQAVSDLWDALFVGCRGVAGFSEKSIINMDWSWDRFYAEVKPAMDRVAAGVGKHVMLNLKPRPEIAVVYSHPSVRMAFIEKREPEHMDLRLKYIHVLRHLGLAFDFVSYEQLENGVFESRGYKALILPDICAMSDAEVAAVRRFAAKGGAVVAEGVPARRAKNGLPRAVSPLAEFVTFPTVDASMTKAASALYDEKNVAKVVAEQLRIEEALSRTPVSAARLKVFDIASGSRYRFASAFTREGRGGARFWGVLCDDDKPRDVRFEFPASGWLCDLVDGRIIGEGSSFTLPLAKGRPYAFELLPVRPALGDVRVSENKVSVTYTPSVDTVVRVRVLDPDGAEVPWYSKNLAVRGGAAAMEVPFALSDRQGTWRVEVRDVLTGETKAAECVRRPLGK